MSCQDYYEDDCENQAMAPTDHCVKWECNLAKLVKKGIFWICPICKGSYGTNPHPKLK